MKYVMAVFALSLAGCAAPILRSGTVVADVPAAEGASVVLYDEAGQCLSGARRAEHITVRGVRTPGCWVATPTGVSIAFWDGEGGFIPASLLKPPRGM